MKYQGHDRHHDADVQAEQPGATHWHGPDHHREPGDNSYGDPFRKLNIAWQNIIYRNTADIIILIAVEIILVLVMLYSPLSSSGVNYFHNMKASNLNIQNDLFINATSIISRTRV